jgi:hypothetical protein
MNNALATYISEPSRQFPKAAELRLARDLQNEMKRVAGMAVALDLREAQLLAWLRRQDLAPLGWPSFSSFCVEHVGWSPGWIRQLVRLVEADLPLIKALAASGELPLYLAVLALSKANRNTERRWVASQRPGSSNKPEGFLLYGDDVQVVVEARDRARLVSGRPLSDQAADRLLLDTHAREQAGEPIAERLLDDGRQTPEWSPPQAIPTWDELVTARLGRWVEPKSATDAVARLRDLENQRRLRVVELGELYSVVRHEWIWLMGHDSHRELAYSLGLSLRSLERHALLVEWLEMFPRLRQALDDGLPLSHIHALGDMVTEDTVDRWVWVAEHTTAAEIKRAVSRAEVERHGPVLAAYEAVIAAATGPDAPATRADATLKVALSGPPPAPTRPVALRVVVGLFEAARWFVDAVQIAPRRGFGRIVDKDRHGCQNPRCSHRSLRVQAHHLLYQSLGGSHEAENLVPVCPGCHLRGIHSGHIQVSRRGDWLVWTYGDGDTVLSYRPHK